MEIVIAIAAKIGEFLVAPIGRRLGYLCHYNSNIEDFEKKVETLETERAAVQLRVDAAERNGEDILPNVRAWLTSVNEITRVFYEVQENKRCFYGHCPDLMSRYQRSKIAKEKTSEADDLKRDGRFLVVVSCSAPSPEIWATSTTDAEVFESRKSVFEKIMGALKDDQINMIGIYGMGGVGKTTLVKEVGKQAKDENLFDEVVMAVVSETPNLIKIQDEIAVNLGLKFDVNTDSGRAGKLFARLTQKQRILVILDDIWKRVELGDIGIPFGAHEGCKILLTSRSQDVCNQMYTQKDFPIEVLSKREAWNLFRKMVGDSVDSPRLRPIAVEIAKECGGLPLAIVAVARALRNKDLSVWRDAANRLKKSFQEKDVSAAPEFSYNQLESEEAKSFFLLCSLFPEDENIAIQELLKYGMGLGLFEDVDRVDEAIDRAHTLAYNLKSSCLLLDGYAKECVRMHDVVRDVAISNIASKDEHVFLVRAGLGLKEWPKKDTYESYTAISISNNDIHELPDGLECPKLQILFLGRNRPSLQFPENFFLRMENLKVLEMSLIHFLSLPPSLRYLKNLRTLCLDRCKLKNISIIGELKKLEVLSILYSDITELPKEMGMLTHLRLLDLRGCGQLAIIPPDVIRGLSQLEALYMKDSFDKWEIEGQQNQRRSNASLADLKCLSRLIILETHILDASLLPEDSLFQNLLRFRISIGIRLERHEGYPKSLSLNVYVSTPSKNGVNVLLKKAEHLQLREMKGLKSIIYGLDREGFPNLRRLDVKACHEVDYVLNATEGVSPVAFPMLERLDLSDLVNLKEICHGQLPTGLFSELQELRLSGLLGLMNMWKDPAQHVCFRNLRVVKVDGCNGLKNLFSHSIAKDLSKLVELHVRNCEIMEEIFGNEKEAASAMDDDIVFPHLRSLVLRNLPNLRNFCSKMKCLALKGDVDSHTEDPLLDKKDAFPALEKLEIYSVGNFEEMWFPQFSAMSFSLLKYLSLYDCDKVLNIVLLNLLPRLRNLGQLYVGECESVEELIEVEGLAVEEGRVIQTLSQLRVLNLWRLPKLKHVWWWWDKWIPHGTLSFLNLRELCIIECHSVKSLFSPYIANCLERLEYLEIESCQKIETIIAEEREGEENRIEIVFHQLRSLKLEKLPKLTSFYTGRCTLPIWRSLKELTISKCPAMRSFTCRSSSVQKQKTNDEIMKEAYQEYKEDAFPALEELVIDVGNFKEMWFPQFSAMSFSQLRVLRLYNCDKVLNIVLLNLLSRLRNLKELRVGNCDSEEELIKVEGLVVEEELIETLSQFITLKLWQSQHLSRWWDKWKPHGTFGYLNLRELYIEKCHGVKSLFSPYIANCLVQLQYLRIESCQMIETIIAKEREGEENCIETIVFPQLDSLTLENLPKLISFCTGRCTLNWLSLKVLWIRECSAMKTFTCRFSSVHDEIMKEATQEYNLDDPIQPLFHKEVTFPTLEEVKLRDLPNLKVFYSGNDNLALPSLKTLQLVDCPKMQTFSSRFISTPKLEKVEIEHNEKVWKDDLNGTVQYIFQEKGKLESVASSGQEVEEEEEEEGEKLNKKSKEAEKVEEEVEREENVSAQAIQHEISEFAEEEA